MKSSSNSQPKARKIWIPLILIVLLAAGGFGYFYWNQEMAVQSKAIVPGSGGTRMAAPAEKAMTTKPVRRGSITLSTS